MDQDYLVFGVDQKRSYSARFLCLNQAISQSLQLHQPADALKTLYKEFLLASVLLGSMNNEQESMLYKIFLPEFNLTLNSEVSPRGMFRSALFTQQQKQNSEAFLKVVTLKKNNQTYQSLTHCNSLVAQEIFTEYLEKSVQTEALLFLHTSSQNENANYGLWLQKLPDTAISTWNQQVKNFITPSLFENAVLTSSDPDKIFSQLFQSPIEILAVTKPKLECTCNKERILKAFESLSADDLVEIFMQESGVETQCEYCRKVWRIEDKEIQKLLKISGRIQ